MAVVPYNSTSAPYGIMTASAMTMINNTVAYVDRIYNRADVLTGAPRDYTKLEGGDFGVIATDGSGTAGEAFWTQLATIRTELHSAMTFVPNLDNGG